MLILLIAQIPITLTKESVSTSSHIALLVVAILGVLEILVIHGNDAIETKIKEIDAINKELEKELAELEKASKEK